MGPPVLKQSMSDGRMPKNAENIKTMPAMARVNVRKPPVAPAITNVGKIRANIRRAARGRKSVAFRCRISGTSAEHEANDTAKGVSLEWLLSKKGPYQADAFVFRVGEAHYGLASGKASPAPGVRDRWTPGAVRKREGGLKSRLGRRRPG